MRTLRVADMWPIWSTSYYSTNKQTEVKHGVLGCVTNY